MEEVREVLEGALQAVYRRELAVFATTTTVTNQHTLAEINTQVDSAFTTQMADSVATDGSIATREQALYETLQFLTEFEVSGTTYTTKKVDGSTTLMTHTIDDATSPTSITRAT